MKKGAFGVVYQDVTRNKNIPAAAKGLYAYLSSFCGVDDECYPSVETITKEMGMGRDTFYRHINILVAAGVVEKRQTIGKDGKYGRTMYRLTHNVEITDFPNTENKVFPNTENEDTDFPTAVHKETNNNNINNNNINNNNNISISSSEPVKQAPDPSGILLPLVDNSDYDVSLSKIEKWTVAYPAVDIKQELNKMAAWLISNPNRKKTRKGIDRFINIWLSKEQDRGGTYRKGSRQQEIKPVEKPSYYKYLGNSTPREDDPFQ